MKKIALVVISLILLLFTSFLSCENRSSRKEKAIREMMKDGYSREDAESELEDAEIESTYRR